MAVKKRGLGRGLSALIPDEPIKEDNEKSSENEKIVELEISLLAPNNEQPRREFDDDKLDELAQSIKYHGVIQPIIVRKKNEGYEIVAGERRWRASKKASLKKVPCIIKEIEQLKSTEIALIENIQREDLNPIEEGLAYKTLIEKHKLTQEEISDIVGKSRPYIGNMTRLLNLDQRVIDLISTGKLSGGHGRTLLSIEDGDFQFKIAKSIIENSLSVRETEKLVKDLSKKKEKVTNKHKTKDPILLNLEESLRKTLGTKVSIVKGRKQSKIEIEDYSDEDLERILDVLSVE